MLHSCQSSLVGGRSLGKQSLLVEEILHTDRALKLHDILDFYYIRIPQIFDEMTAQQHSTMNHADFI
jgi:hypothetical protein